MTFEQWLQSQGYVFREDRGWGRMYETEDGSTWRPLTENEDGSGGLGDLQEQYNQLQIQAVTEPTATEPTATVDPLASMVYDSQAGLDYVPTPEGGSFGGFFDAIVKSIEDQAEYDKFVIEDTLENFKEDPEGEFVDSLTGENLPPIASAAGLYNEFSGDKDENEFNLFGSTTTEERVEEAKAEGIDTRTAEGTGYLADFLVPAAVSYGLGLTGTGAEETTVADAPTLTDAELDLLYGSEGGGLGTGAGSSAPTGEIPAIEAPVDPTGLTPEMWAELLGTPTPGAEFSLAGGETGVLSPTATTGLQPPTTAPVGSTPVNEFSLGTTPATDYGIGGGTSVLGSPPPAAPLTSPTAPITFGDAATAVGAGGLAADALNGGSTTYPSGAEDPNAGFGDTTTGGGTTSTGGGGTVLGSGGTTTTGSSSPWGAFASDPSWETFGRLFGSSILPAGLGYLGAKEQADAFERVANQNLAIGAPYRTRLDASYQPGFDLLSQPGYGDAFDRIADISARSYSSKFGNPYDSPTAKAGILGDVWNQGYLPTLSNYRGQLGQFGGLGLNTAGNAQLGGASTAGGGFNAIGAGLANATREPSPWDSLARQMALNIGGTRYTR